jgi:hypothetical protein
VVFFFNTTTTTKSSKNKQNKNQKIKTGRAAGLSDPASFYAYDFV